MQSRRHQMRFYETPDEMLEVATRLVEATTARTVIVADNSACELLRDRVPQDGRLLDVDATALRSGRIAHALMGSIGEGTDDECCVINAVTPSTARGWEEWLLYEVALNLLASDRMELHCLLDRGALPAMVEDRLVASHPYLVMSASVQLNPGFRSPAAAIAGFMPPPLPDGPAQVVLLDPVEPSTMRRALAGVSDDFASRAAMANFAVACTEVVTNAIRHGQRPIEVRLWTGDVGITVSVHDSGPGPRDALLGLMPPKPGQIGGLGMWIARSWSDWLNVIRDPTGCEVRLGLDPRPSAG